MPLVLLQVCRKSSIKNPKDQRSRFTQVVVDSGVEAESKNYRVSTDISLLVAPNTPQLWESTTGSHGTIVVTLGSSSV